MQHISELQRLYYRTSNLLKFMRKFLLTSIFFFCCLVSFAQKQNLIPNGDFEDFKRCPNDHGQLGLLYGWFEPTFNKSSELYDECAVEWHYKTPKNGMGFQTPRSGTAYIGFVFGNMSNEEKYYDYREYASAKLKQKLKKDKLYKLNFFLSLVDTSYAAISAQDVGIYFSKDSIAMPESHGFKSLPFQSSVKAHNTTGFLIDTINWMEIIFFYKALGDEKYITIGNFNDDINTSYQIVNNSSIRAYPFSYYLIDDVSLYEIDIIPQDIGLDSIAILGECQDSVGLRVVNSGDSALNFKRHPFTLELELKEDGIVRQRLQKAIDDNRINPIAGEPLEVDSSIWVYFTGLNYPKPNGNYTLSIQAIMAEDGDSTNNLIDTSFYKPRPIDTLFVNKNTICKGESVELTYRSNSNVNAIWQSSTDLQSWENRTSSSSFIFQPLSDTYFRIAYCGFYTDTLLVKVNELPQAIYAEFHFCDAGKQRLELDSLAKDIKLNWYSTASDKYPFHTGTSYEVNFQENTNYYLESEKEACVSKERGLLSIQLGDCDLIIPNVFTPNGDGINDVFQYRHAFGRELQTTIYNRYGNKVAAFKDNDGWDGKGQAAGVYYYVITSKEGEEYKGTVTLLR